MTIRVMIIDDHAIVRAGLRRILDSAPDISVASEAANGLAALMGVDVCKPDVLLADISMPGMSGMELIGRVHESHPHLPVLVLSMHKGRIHEPGPPEEVFSNPKTPELQQFLGAIS